MFVLSLAYVCYKLSFLFPARFIWLQYCRNHMSSKRTDRIRAEPSLTFPESTNLKKIIGKFARKRIYNGCPVRLKIPSLGIIRIGYAQVAFAPSYANLSASIVSLKRVICLKKSSSTSSIHFLLQKLTIREVLCSSFKLLSSCSHTGVAVTLRITATLCIMASAKSWAEQNISHLMTKPTKWHAHPPSLIRVFAVRTKKSIYIYCHTPSRTF